GGGRSRSSGWGRGGGRSSVLGSSGRSSGRGGGGRRRRQRGCGQRGRGPGLVVGAALDWIGRAAGAGVGGRRRKEGADEKQAAHQDDEVQLVVVAQVHEVKRHQRTLDRRHQKRNESVGAAEVEARHSDGDGGEHHQRRPDRNIDTNGQNVRLFAVSVLVVR